MTSSHSRSKRLELGAEYIKGLWQPRNSEFAGKPSREKVASDRSANELIELEDRQQHREHDQQHEAAHEHDHERTQQSDDGG